MKTIFVTHGFRFHNPWKEVNSLIEKNLTDQFLNVSIPWHDPSFLPYDEWGKNMIDDALKSQATRVDIFVLVQSLLESKSARQYVIRQIEISLSTNSECKVISFCNSDPQDFDRLVFEHIVNSKHAQKIRRSRKCTSSRQVVAAIVLEC